MRRATPGLEWPRITSAGVYSLSHPSTIVVYTHLSYGHYFAPPEDSSRSFGGRPKMELSEITPPASFANPGSHKPA